MATCLIGLGSNLGPREELLREAFAALAADPRVARVTPSRLIETASVGGPAGQSAYLNAAARVETSLEPHALLDLLQQIERRLGRQRHTRWGPRSIDLDLLLYDQIVVSTPELIVPHPRMAWRRFVLEPATEVAADMVHPATGWTIARLFEHLRTATAYVAIAGGIAAGKTELAKAVAAQCGAQWIAEPIDPQLLGTFYRDPVQQAWHTEMALLDQRTALLGVDQAVWREPTGWIVSDFWFDQSLAFAGVWLPPDRLAEFRRRWHDARQRVVRPKLTVLLDASAEALHQRVLQRARPFELALSTERLEQIRQAVAQQTRLPDQGPVLLLHDVPFEVACQEVLAALEAMR